MRTSLGHWGILADTAPSDLAQMCTAGEYRGQMLLHLGQMLTHRLVHAGYSDLIVGRVSERRHIKPCEQVAALAGQGIKLPGQTGYTYQRCWLRLSLLLELLRAFQSRW